MDKHTGGMIADIKKLLELESLSPGARDDLQTTLNKLLSRQHWSIYGTRRLPERF